MFEPFLDVFAMLGVEEDDGEQKLEIFKKH